MTKIPIIAKELKDYPHVPVSALIPMQGSLKDLKKREYDKLKKLMLELGIFMPFAVWMETGKLLDGHQRLRVFEGEGWDFDVPVLYVSAANEQEAKQKLLAISSQFGKVTQEGFDEFTYDLSDDWIEESVHFDALPLVFSDFQPTAPANDPYAEWEGMPEFEQDDKTSFRSIHIHFKSQQDIDKFAERIGQKLTDKTRSIWYPRVEKINMRDYYEET